MSQHTDRAAVIVSPLPAQSELAAEKTVREWILTPWRCGVVGYSRVQWLVRDCALELARAYNEGASAWSFILG